MASRTGISIHKPMLVMRTNHCLALQRPLCAWILFAAIAFGLATEAAFAQETPKPETQTGTSSGGTSQGDTSQDNQPPSAPSKIAPVTLYNLLQRKSIVFPDIAASTERLSIRQKFELFVDNSVSLHTLTWAAVGSAVGLACDSPTGFGHDGDGYAERFGTSMARQASSNFFGTFLLASALRQDPRFYPEIKPGFSHAVKYSVKRIFVTRSDNGRDAVNWSGLAGPLMAEGLANVYWPEQNRTAGDTFLRYGLDLATKAGGNMLREYWPVLHGKISHAQQPAKEKRPAAVF